MGMEITIYDDGEETPEPLWKQLKRAEKKLAEEEGREPEGWYFIEGMEGPEPIDFSGEP